jgi:hypothetical protein
MRVDLRKIMKKIQNLTLRHSSLQYNLPIFPFLSLNLESSFTVPTALPQSQDQILILDPIADSLYFWICLFHTITRIGVNAV